MALCLIVHVCALPGKAVRSVDADSMSAWCHVQHHTSLLISLRSQCTCIYAYIYAAINHTLIIIHNTSTAPNSMTGNEQKRLTLPPPTSSSVTRLSRFRTGVDFSHRVLFGLVLFVLVDRLIAHTTTIGSSIDHVGSMFFGSRDHQLPYSFTRHNSTITWSVCPDTPKNEPYTFYCSLLTVPTNWIDPVEEETTEIFMRLLPAEKNKKLGTMVR